MGILGIPLISLNLLDEGVNFLDILTSNCTSFIYIFCCIEFSLTGKGFALVMLGEFCVPSLFCTNCASFKPTLATYFLNCYGLVLSFMVVLHNLYLTFVVPHV
jgi:hypothetical protein